ncbi:MAG: SUMF1/EgtB/PvdO family nonheme iron enzyme [Pseudomonadota bacterium]
MKRLFVHPVLVVALLLLCLGDCTCLRPAGLTRLPADPEKDFVSVATGWFVTGGAPACWDNQTFSATCSDAPAQFPWRLAYLTGYRIMNREVTNAEYLECVQAGECAYWDACYTETPVVAEMISSIASDVCPYTRKEVALEPARDVSWIEARTYCRWRYRHLGLNADLPTEAQWERAAVGPAVDGNAFAQPPLPLPGAGLPAARIGCEDAVQSIATDDEEKLARCTNDPAWPESTNPVYKQGTEHPFAVLTYGEGWSANLDGDKPRAGFATADGVRDLAGNVAEWVVDALSSRCEGAETFLGSDFAVRDDCAGALGDPMCASRRVADLGDASDSELCNPVVGDTDSTNLARVTKGGHYKASSWCELNPRARVGTFDSDKTIGFRCAVWDDAPETRKAICNDLANRMVTAPPIASPVTDAGSGDSSAGDSAATDSSAPDVGQDAGSPDVEDASVEDAAGLDI